MAGCSAVTNEFGATNRFGADTNQFSTTTNDFGVITNQYLGGTNLTPTGGTNSSGLYSTNSAPPNPDAPK